MFHNPEIIRKAYDYVSDVWITFLPMKKDCETANKVTRWLLWSNKAHIWISQED